MTSIHEICVKAGRVHGSCKTPEQMLSASKYYRLAMRRCRGANAESMRYAFHIGRLQIADEQRRALTNS